MTTHGYGHSIDDEAPASSAQVIRNIPGFSQPGVNNDPDRVDLGPQYDGAWGEDIGAQASPIEHTYEAWSKGQISEAGFYQRSVFYDTMAYIIDWGNAAHTDSAGNFPCCIWSPAEPSGR